MDKIGVFCSSSDKMEAVYYEQTEMLGRWMGEKGKTLVYGGSRCGLMETIARSVKLGGGKVFGVVPRKVIQNEMMSEHIDVVFHTDNLRDRKQWLIDESDIMIALPGSVGTLDEAFSAMAENTFGMHSKKIIFWNINGFWNDLFLMIDNLEGKGVVSKPFCNFMLRAETLQQVIDFIES